MQISDELLKLVSDLEIAVFNGAPRPAIVGSFGRLRAALSALSLPVQPVAKRWLVEETLEGGSIKWNCVEHEHHARSMVSPVGNPVTVTPLYTTPPVPPTKGPEDDLPEGWEGSADAMVWAKAYRYFVLKNNLTMSEAIDPGYMVGWFANYWAAITRDRLEPSAEDDLIAAREAAADIEINYVVCDPKEVREQVAAAIMDALRKDRAIRSPPASALPVVGEDGAK